MTIEGLTFARIQNPEAQWAAVLQRDRSEERGILSCIACGADLVGDLRDGLNGASKQPPILAIVSDPLDSRLITMTGLLCTRVQARRWCDGNPTGPDRKPQDRVCPALGRVRGLVLAGTEDPLRYVQRLLVAGEPKFTNSALRRLTQVVLGIAFAFELPPTVEQPTPVDTPPPPTDTATTKGVD